MSKPSRHRRTLIVTRWPDGATTESPWLLDHQVQVAILSRLRVGAKVHYIIRCIPRSPR